LIPDEDKLATDEIDYLAHTKYIWYNATQHDKHSKQHTSNIRAAYYFAGKIFTIK